MSLIRTHMYVNRVTSKFEWYSKLKVGQLLWDGDSFEVEWTNNIEVAASMNTNNRSMELSEIVWWNGNYYTVTHASKFLIIQVLI
jgi:vancomycin permeability regulator SanA